MPEPNEVARALDVGSLDVDLHRELVARARRHVEPLFDAERSALVPLVQRDAVGAVIELGAVRSVGDPRRSRQELGSPRVTADAPGSKPGGDLVADQRDAAGPDASADALWRAARHELLALADDAEASVGGALRLPRTNVCSAQRGVGGGRRALYAGSPARTASRVGAWRHVFAVLVGGSAASDQVQRERPRQEGSERTTHRTTLPQMRPLVNRIGRLNRYGRTAHAGDAERRERASGRRSISAQERLVQRREDVRRRASSTGSRAPRSVARTKRERSPHKAGFGSMPPAPATAGIRWSGITLVEVGLGDGPLGCARVS